MGADFTCQRHSTLPPQRVHAHIRDLSSHNEVLWETISLSTVDIMILFCGLISDIRSDLVTEATLIFTYKKIVAIKHEDRIFLPFNN